MTNPYGPADHPTTIAKLIEVIYVESTRGAGVPGDPVRIVKSYWTTDGERIAEFDTWTGRHLYTEDLTEFHGRGSVHVSDASS